MPAVPSPSWALAGRLLALTLLLAALPARPLAAQTPALAPGDHDVVVNGVRLAYRVAGPAAPAADAAPVLFLHGGPGYNSHSFSVLAGPALERARTMIYLDQRGCGRSERPWDGAYSLDLLVADLEGLRQALGVPRLVLMGHSFGGLLALEYAARHPEHVAGLVLVGALSDGPASVASWGERLAAWHPEALPEKEPDGGAGAPTYDAVMGALAQVDGQAFFDRMQFRDDAVRARQDRVDAESGLQNTGELSRALFEQGLGAYRFEAAGAVAAPALVVAGRYDYAIGLASMEQLAARLPRAELAVYEASAHFPYLEEPDRFARDVAAFLERLDG